MSTTYYNGVAGRLENGTQCLKMDRRLRSGDEAWAKGVFAAALGVDPATLFFTNGMQGVMALGRQISAAELATILAAIDPGP